MAAGVYPDECGVTGLLQLSVMTPTMEGGSLSAAADRATTLPMGSSSHSSRYLSRLQGLQLVMCRHTTSACCCSIAAIGALVT